MTPRRLDKAKSLVVELLRGDAQAMGDLVLKVIMLADFASSCGVGGKVDRFNVSNEKKRRTRWNI